MELVTSHSEGLDLETCPKTSSFSVQLFTSNRVKLMKLGLRVGTLAKEEYHYRVGKGILSRGLEVTRGMLQECAEAVRVCKKARKFGSYLATS